MITGYAMYTLSTGGDIKHVPANFDSIVKHKLVFKSSSLSISVHLSDIPDLKPPVIFLYSNIIDHTCYLFFFQLMLYIEWDLGSENVFVWISFKGNKAHFVGAFWFVKTWRRVFSKRNGNRNIDLRASCLKLLAYLFQLVFCVLDPS